MQEPMDSRQPSSSTAAAAAAAAAVMCRHQEVLLGKYELGRLLGHGTFAKVYLARSVSDGDAVAVKILDKAEMVETGMAHSVLTEVAAMRCLSHPNILKLYEVLATRSKIFLVMEHAPGGDLLSRVARRRLPEHAARRYLHQLVSALHYCHARGIAHRDVKPQNLLLDRDGHLKISDFGLAALPDRLRDGLLLTACGTPAYTAPEVFRRKGYDGAAADAWSCGVILFVLLAGSLPFDDTNLAVMYRRIHRRDYELPTWISPPARRLLVRLLDPNPDTRMTIAHLLDHPWLKRSLSLDSQLDNLAPPPLAAAHAMNAFDIISLSSGLDLSPLFDDAKANKERRFTSMHTIDKIMDTIQLAGSKLGLVVETEKSAATATAVRGCGSVLSVEVSEVLYPILLVEMRLQHDCLGGGAAAEFCWENVKAELGDVVFSWHETEQRES